MSDLVFEDKNAGDYVQDEENGEKVEKDNIKYLIAVYRCTTNRYHNGQKILWCGYGIRDGKNSDPGWKKFGSERRVNPGSLLFCVD
jgi:hypothetical protein